MEQIVVLLVDPGQNPISAPLLITELKILVPSWAIFDTLAHMTSIRAWVGLDLRDMDFYFYL
jgi:hypothetical protein